MGDNDCGSNSRGVIGGFWTPLVVAMGLAGFAGVSLVKYFSRAGSVEEQSAEEAEPVSEQISLTSKE